MPRIACLGWGSLVWNRCELPTKGWFADGPSVRAEFLRQSDNGCITLVLHGSAPASRAYWALLDVHTVEDAAEALRVRERIPKTKADAIGRWWTGDASPSLIVDLETWAKTKQVDAVVWTALSPKFEGTDGRVPSAHDVVSYLRSRTGSVREIAEQYVRRAPKQISTPYRQKIEAELGWTPPDVEAEIALHRDFIAFVERQQGVYCDCLAGFSGNKVRIEQQVPRVLHPTGRVIKDSRPTIVVISVEDPASPDVILQRITRTDDFITANAEGGFNEQHICWAIIIFIYAYWNEEIRPRIAGARGVNADQIMVDAFGDLRILRHAILHDNGVLLASQHAKLRVMGALCRADSLLALTHEQMKRLFELTHQGVAQLLLEHTGHAVGAPTASEILKVAIQQVRPQ
jgi:hypothetical protein